MSKRLAYTKYNLGYPPWALEFDPYNRGYLLVGGGGGEQKEVPNRLTLLDVSSRSTIQKTAELSTSPTEDHPVSLGVLSYKEGLIAYTGINSGKEERENGTNSHFRSFKVDFPARAKEQSEKQEHGSITPLGKTSLFSPSANSGDVFQRLLRLSPASRRANGSKRIGAIANSLAKESEIVIFNATAASPSSADVIQRLKPLQKAEANDIDIYETKEGEFQITYCTQTEVYLQTINYDFAAKKATKVFPKEPYAVYSMPYPDAFQTPGRGRIRCLRFLTPHHLLLLANKGGRSDFVILKIYPDGVEGDVVLRKQLPKRMGACVSVDVCVLDADSMSGARQIAVAVAAQSEDISIYTLDYSGTSKDTLSTFTLYSDLRSVHSIAMKRVVLSPFHPPWPSESSSSSESKPKTPGPQYLRLASISLSNELVVDFLPLHPVAPTKRGSRYILSKSGRTSSALQTGGSILGIAFVLLISLLLAQSFLNLQTGGSHPSIQLLPQAVLNKIDPYASRISQIISPYIQRAEESADPLLRSKSAERIKSLLHLHYKTRDVPSEQQKTVVIRVPEAGEAELSTEVHADTAELLKQDAQAKKWEEMSKSERERWKERLVKAGAWSADYGETILKGIFFSEVAGAVGRAAAQALAGGN
jgi:prolactin regulatory element-binding protein